MLIASTNNKIQEENKNNNYNEFVPGFGENNSSTEKYEIEGMYIF